MNRLKRSSNKIFGGVLGGFADYFQIDPVWLRLGYLVFGFINFGAALLLYIIALIIMPKDDKIKGNVINVETEGVTDEIDRLDQEDTNPEVEYKAEENGEKGENTAKKAEPKQAERNNSNRKPLILIGFGLILAGAVLLFEEIYNIEIWSSIVLYYHMLKEYIFPILLIFFGFWILFKGRK